MLLINCEKPDPVTGAYITFVRGNKYEITDWDAGTVEAYGHTFNDVSFILQARTKRALYRVMSNLKFLGPASNHV